MGLMEFAIYKDKKNEWRWTLVHRNGNVMADSGEGYKRKSRCLTAIRSLRLNIPDATITTK